MIQDPTVWSTDPAEQAAVAAIHAAVTAQAAVLSAVQEALELEPAHLDPAS